MYKLRAKLIAYSNADLQVFSKAKKRLLSLFHQEKVEFVDNDPDILVFLTGGSERQATQTVQKNKFYLLIASSGDNSWAAATEVKSWMNNQGIASILTDQANPNSQLLVDAFFHVMNGLANLKGKRYGLIGTPSDWLVNSVVDPELAKAKLGVEQVSIPWSDININETESVASDFLSFFSSGESLGISDAGKVYEALAKVISKHQLNAVSVECFSLVNSCNTTACLALAKLSMDGIPAGCEGDTCSMLGLMLAKEICGITPWMANIAHVVESKVLLAHCTIPANLVSDFSLETHFETDKGVAINGRLRGEEFTFFRFDSKLSRMFIAKGTSVKSANSKTACRTQLTLEVDPKYSECLISNPLGNHHLVLPGNHVNALNLAAEVLSIKVLP